MRSMDKQTSGSDETVLYTFAVSHFSEKIRWLMDACGLPYQDVQWTPFFHLPRARLKSGQGTTVPILAHRGKVVQDSTAILMYLEQREGELPVLPQQESVRSEVLAIEERADRAGSHIIRVGYPALLADKEAFLAAWSVSASAAEHAALRVLFPVLKTLLAKAFRLDPDSCLRSRRVLDETLSWLDDLLVDNRTFLVGESLTIADISMASLLAPVVCPDQHAVYGSPLFRGAVQPIVEAYQQRPAVQWVKQMYQDYRYAGTAH